MVLALRGQWRERTRGAGQRLPDRNGKPWSRGEDVVLGAAFAAGTPLTSLAQALSRTPVAVLTRAVHLGLLREARPVAWPDGDAEAPRPGTP